MEEEDCAAEDELTALEELFAMELDCCELDDFTLLLDFAEEEDFAELLLDFAELDDCAELLLEYKTFGTIMAM